MMDAYGPHTHHAHYDQQHFSNSASYYSHVPPNSAASTQGFSSYDFATPSTSSFDQYTLPSNSGGVLAQLPSVASTSTSNTDAYSGSSNLTASSIAAASALSQPQSQTHTSQSSQSSSHFYGHHAKSASLSSNSSSARSSPLPQTTGTAVTIPSPSPSNPSNSNQSTGKPQVVVHGTPLSRPLTHKESELLAHLDRLKFFLATAPSRWVDADNADEDPSTLVGNGMNGMGTPMMPHPNSHPALNRFLLPSGEYVSCVLWSGLYHITGTDIVRALVFRFEAFGRPVRNMKKFEEGVFSDLRNLKPGTDACLEEPKSPFLDLLFKYQCIRTQKKQKVFYWFSVPHDRLFLDALERDLKREKMGLEPTTHVVGEPALSFTYDSKRTLYEQFSKAQGAQEGEGELETAVRRAEESLAAEQESELLRNGMTDNSNGGNGSNTLFNMFSLFEGSPNYKQRRKKGPRTARSALARDSSEDDREGSHGAISGEVVDDTDGELNASAMFEAQMGLGGSTTGRHVQAQRQADSQRLVQAHHLAMLNRSRPQRHATAPISHSPYHLSPRGPYSVLASNHSHSNSLPSSLSGNGANAPTAGPRKTKAFVCPLYSCQRLFKRLEHLKRHVRMHTMERPFKCEACGRRFSRQDNLSQHLRTHQRDGAQVSLDAPGEADGEENVDQVDLNTCEIEVTDQMRIEDEDGFSIPPPSAGNGVFGMAGGNDAAFPAMVMSPENSPRLNGQGEWMGMSGHSNSLPASYEIGSTQSSPSFGNTNVGLSRYTTPYGNPSSASTAASYLSNEYTNTTFSGASVPSSAGSLSAPAHKQTFDHNTLYPTSLGLGLQGLAASNASIGPVRRYRSVTPTIPRVGESIRRPSTANFEMGAYGNGAAAAAANGVNGAAAVAARGYHPYAMQQQQQQYSASAASSPAQFNAQLMEFTQQQQQSQQQQQTPSTAQHSPAGSVYQDELQSLIGNTAMGGFDGAAGAGSMNATYNQVYANGSAAAQNQYTSAAAGATATGVSANAGNFFNLGTTSANAPSSSMF